MARAPPAKATTYGKPRGKVVPAPKKEPSPTPDEGNDDENEESLSGKLLEECDDTPPAPSKIKSKPTTTKSKAPPKPTAPKKGNQSSPPSSKPAPKSKLSHEVKSVPSPRPKSKSSGHETESDYDSEEEKAKVAAKSIPKPIKGKKGDSSKLPSSNDSTKSSTQIRSASTRKAAISAKNEIFKKPVPADDDEDEFGTEFDGALVDALEDFETKGMSSSPTALAKTNVNQSPTPNPNSPADIVMNAAEEDEDTKSAEPEPESQLSGAMDIENEIPEDNDEERSSQGDDDEDDNSQSPNPKTRTPAPRSVKNLDLKRAADYDSNLAAESEGGLAGLLLADMASPSKRPRTSKSSEKIEKIKKLEVAASKPSPKPPVQKPLTTPKNVRGRNAPAPLPSPIDYASMIAPYGKEVVQRLMLKQFESIKKCDWYELSIEMAAEGVKRVSNGRKGKKAQDKEIINGNDLHDIFHNVSSIRVHAGDTGLS